MKGRSTIARRLREARLRVGLSQKKLGILAGMDEFSASARVNQYETGKHVPEFTTAERLAKVLGVPPPYLYCTDDELAHWLLAFQDAPLRLRRTVLNQVKRSAK